MAFPVVAQFVYLSKGFSGADFLACSDSFTSYSSDEGH